jgi:DNA-binding transcriptional MocR family regulator
MNELEYEIKLKRPKGFYIVTTIHNPSGHNLSIQQRNKLYNLSKKYRFYIITDDVYDLLYFNPSQRFPSLFYCSDVNIRRYYFNQGKSFEYDNNSNEFIISLFSFSKIVNPGWRMVIMI